MKKTIIALALACGGILGATDAMAATGCYVYIYQCPNHPEAQQRWFQDGDPSANSNPEVCLARSRTYTGACSSYYSVYTGFVVDGHMIIMGNQFGDKYHP